MSTVTDFSTLDEEKFNAFHWRMLITTGMGVFCDGYDLSSIAIVLPMVLASFGIHQIGGFQSAMLAASALVGSALGAMIFGVLGQFGRKRFYGLDVLLMGVMAAAQAFAPDLTWLVMFRFILGIGIGADYVLSPTITVEHANRANRGKMIGLGFALMWLLGSLTAALLNLLLAQLHVSDDLQWRIVLAAGALPALATLYLRRTMPETARYLARLAARPDDALAVIRQISGQCTTAPTQDNRPFTQVFAQHARMIFSAALLWMVYDMAVYPGDLFGPSLIGKSLDLTPIEFSLIIQIGFSIPSILIYSFFVLDQLGRKKLQIFGFFGATIFLVIFALLNRYVPSMPLLGLLAFGLYSVAINGAFMVSGTGILGVELTPTRIRTVGQAVTVIGGRIGASIGGFLFPLIFTSSGEAWAIALMAGLALLGAALTQILIPETAGVSLETLNHEELQPALTAFSISQKSLPEPLPVTMEAK